VEVEKNTKAVMVYPPNKNIDQPGVFIRTNGRGNAWPIPLGSLHPFYSAKNFEDLSNASYSLISSEKTEITKESIKWEIMVDGGHGAVQFLIMQQNRIPDAIFITHPHHDHTYSIDWIIQSYFRANNRKKKYPLYASRKCFDYILITYPHLKELIEYKELIFGKQTRIDEAPGLSATAFPVYHGKTAPGASMVIFQFDNKTALFTGDVLCPLIRIKDYPSLQNISAVYCDANNRFPWPLTNHWSIVDFDPQTVTRSQNLKKFKNHLKLSEILESHNANNIYFDKSIDDQFINDSLSYSMFDFLKKINPVNVFMVHYSGREDSEQYKQEMFDAEKLVKWTSEEAEKIELDCHFHAPSTGHIFRLI